MPYKNKKAKRAFKKYKKVFKKKAEKYGAVIQKSIAGVPPATMCKLRWTNTSQVLAPNETPSRFSDQLVLLNDPTQNNTVAPQGWTFHKLLYDKYIVEGCSIKVTFTNTSLTIPQRVYVVPVQADGISTYAQVVVTQIPHCKMKYLSVQTGGKDCMTIKNYVSMTQLTGQKIDPQADDYWGYTGSSNSGITFAQPRELWYWRYGSAVTSVSNIDPLFPVYVDYEITYYVRFYDRLQGTY